MIQSKHRIKKAGDKATTSHSHQGFIVEITVVQKLNQGAPTNGVKSTKEIREDNW